LSVSGWGCSDPGTWCVGRWTEPSIDGDATATTRRNNGIEHDVEMLQERVAEQPEKSLRLQALVSELDPPWARAAKEQTR